VTARRVWIALGLLLGGCAGPVQELWPPEKGAPTHTIVVSLDTWHAMIAFPISGKAEGRGPWAEPQPFNPGPQSPLYEEWGYAEQAWYLEGRQGVSGALRALLWPTSAVVEVGLHDRVWAERTPQPPSDRFTFHIGEEGYRRLRRYVQSSIAAPEPIATIGTSRFYPAIRSYHLFHHCHQYSARALREAGLPISSFWALTRESFALQLRRAARMEAEAESSQASGGLARGSRRSTFPDL